MRIPALILPAALLASCGSIVPFEDGHIPQVPTDVLEAEKQRAETETRCGPWGIEHVPGRSGNDRGYYRCGRPKR